MEISQLLQFQVVAKYENFTKAAAELYMTQSALSKSIRQLEAELGYELFDRRGKVIALNQAGKIVLRFANHMIDMTNLMKSSLEDVTPSKGAFINMATTRPIINHHLFPKLRVQHPELRLYTKLVDVNKNEAVSLLTSGIYDLLITNFPLDDDEIVSLEHSTEKMCLCVTKDSPLALQPVIKKEDFAGLVIPATKYSYDTMLKPLQDELKGKNLSFETFIVDDTASVNYIKKISDVPSIITDVAWSFGKMPNRTIVEIEGVPLRRNYINYLVRSSFRVEAVVNLLMTDYKDFSDK